MRLRLIAIVFVLLLVACNSEDKPVAELESSTRNTAPTHSQTTTNDVSTPAELTASGAIVYIQDGNLLIWDFATKTSTPIADQVEPEQLFLSPDATMLAYHRRERGLSEVYMFNKATMISTLLDSFETFTNRQIWQVSWSPDNQWVLIGSNGIDLIVKVDGTDRQEVGRDSRIQNQWLADNTILSIVAYSSNFDGSLVVEKIGHYDPTTQTTTPLELGSEYPDYSTFYQAIADLGYDLSWRLGDAPPTDDSLTITWPADYDGSRLVMCATWQVTSFDQSTVYYEASDTAQLSANYQLGNGEFLFLEWRYPNCQFGVPKVRMLRLNADGEVSTLGEDIYPGESQDVRRVAWIGNRFVVSPDEQAVVWISGNIQQTEGALHLTNLATGDSTVLIAEPIANIFWMP